MKKIINLTGHDVNVKGPDGIIINIPSQGQLRAKYTTNDLGNLDSEFGKIPISQNFYQRIKGMPLEVPGTFYIVSRLVAELYPERSDLLMVNGLIKENARAIACRSLSRI
jgi:hypothetical protein